MNSIGNDVLDILFRAIRQLDDVIVKKNNQIECLRHAASVALGDFTAQGRQNVSTARLLREAIESLNPPTPAENPHD
jgi:hypothetical protein